ncbi:unnamed protein product [Effrenium voratum]|nr:unnamed protein product [Effrenium voratum]
MEDEIREVLQKYPGIDAQSLPWPDDISQWTRRDIDIFVGSGGFIKPKRKATPTPSLSAEPLKAEPLKAEPPQEDLCGTLRGKCQGCQSCAGYRRWPGVGGG